VLLEITGLLKAGDCKSLHVSSRKGCTDDTVFSTGREDIPHYLFLSALYLFHSNAKLRPAQFLSGGVVREASTFSNSYKCYPSYL